MKIEGKFRYSDETGRNRVDFMNCLQIDGIAKCVID